ncbi:MAG: GNAT family N-acetyltransferase [Oscillospiraceae bacterium]
MIIMLKIMAGRGGKMTFQQGKSEDIQAIYELSKATIDQYEDIQNIKYDYVLDWVKKKIESNIDKYNTVFYDGKKVGYLYFHEDGSKFELDDLYIIPEYRNKGIGSEILEGLIKKADKTIFLYVFSRNTGAIRLYEKFGFKITENVGKTRYIMEKEVQ